MNVYENIAFGLRMNKIPKNEITRKVKTVLEIVRVQGSEGRYPRECYGRIKVGLFLEKK